MSTELNRIEETSILCCKVCSSTKNLLRCARCKITLYCSKEHQKLDWKRHKMYCKQDDCKYANNRLNVNNTTNQLPVEGSSKRELLIANSEHFFIEPQKPTINTDKTLVCAKTAMPITSENIVHPRKSSVKDFTEVALKSSLPTTSGGQTGEALFLQNLQIQHDIPEYMYESVIKDLNDYGVCVVEHFLDYELAKCVLDEVLLMHSKGIFRDGQLVTTKCNSNKSDLKIIRGDQVCWVDGNEGYCNNIHHLISKVDLLIMTVNRMVNNGKLGQYIINSRTKVTSKNLIKKFVGKQFLY